MATLRNNRLVDNLSADFARADHNHAYGGGSGSGARNPIINGIPLIWQRGTSFVAVPNATYTADRWLYAVSGGVVHTVTQDTSAPTVTQAGVLIPYSIKLDVTTADTSITTFEFCVIEQGIEGYNWLQLAQRQFTLGFWVRDTKTGIHCVSFRNAGFDRSYVAEYTISSADTWEYKTITVPASPTAGTWDYINGLGIIVGWALSSGSTYQTTANAWQTGNFVGTSNQVNATDSTANNFYLTGVTITPGILPEPPTIADYQSELARCMRYYEKQGGGADVIWIGGTAAGGGETWRANFSWTVPKRVNPSVSFAGTWNTVNVATGPALLATSTSRCTIYITTSGAGSWQYNTNSTDDFLVASAEF